MPAEQTIKQTYDHPIQVKLKHTDKPYQSKLTCSFEYPASLKEGFGVRIKAKMDGYFASAEKVLVGKLKHYDEEMGKRKVGDERERYWDVAKKELRRIEADIQVRGEEHLKKFAEAEKKLNRGLVYFRCSVALKVTVDITAASVGAGVGVAAAVLSGGTAIPISGAAVAGSLSVLTKSAATLKAAFEGFDSAADKLADAHRKACRQIEQQKLKASKPDPGLKDKIKKFFATDPAKDLKQALFIFNVKMQEANHKLDHYHALLSDLKRKKQELDNQTVRASPAIAEKVKKLQAIIDYKQSKYVALSKRMAEAAVTARAAAKLIAAAESGDTGNLVASKIVGVAKLGPVAAEMVTDVGLPVAEAIISMAKA